MFLIKGYKVQGKDIVKLDDILSEIKKVIHASAMKQYNALLSREIENLVDNIALNAVPAPKVSIFDEAASYVNNKIGISISKHYKTEYNLSAFANILVYKNNTYIELCTYNNEYVNALDDIEILSAFHVEQLPGDLGIHPDEEAKLTTWKKIFDKYKDDSVMTVKLYPIYKMEKPAFTDLTFSKVADRAETKARHSITDILLSQYSFGEQIAPFKLTEVIDDALSKLYCPDISEEVSQKTKELINLLPEITEEMINKVHFIPEK